MNNRNQRLISAFLILIHFAFLIGAYGLDICNFFTSCQFGPIYGVLWSWFPYSSYYLWFMFIWSTVPLILTVRKILSFSLKPGVSGVSVWAKAYQIDKIFIFASTGQLLVITFHSIITVTLLYSSIFGSDCAMLALNGIQAMTIAMYDLI